MPAERSPDPRAPTAARTMHRAGLSTAPDWHHRAQSTLPRARSSSGAEEQPTSPEKDWLPTHVQAGGAPARGALLLHDTEFNLSFCRELMGLSAWLFARETYNPSNFKISIMLLNLSSHLVRKLWEKR